MIKDLKVINKWQIFSADEFKEVFQIADNREDTEFDEDFIMEHLSAMERVFIIDFVESPRDNTYEEYWVIKELEK